MSEALRTLEPAAPVSAPLALVVEQPVAPVEVVNDNQLAPRVGERVGFEVPAWIWGAMVACFAAFLGLLLAATGGGRAIFAIVISAVYVGMFFGTARAMLGQAPTQPRSPISRPGGRMETVYGPWTGGEVATQMLLVPATIVFFGVAVLAIRLAVF